MRNKTKPTEEEKHKALSKVKETKGNRKVAAETDLVKEMTDQYQHGYDALQTVRNTWDDKESMLVNINRDGITTNATKSSINDPRLATIVIERAARVMAQLPSGKTQALTMKDNGKNAFMNLAVSKYINPNANSQFDLLTKFRMWDVYSDVYGSFPMLVDYVISDSYVGPDCYLTPLRSFIPQPGRVSVNDLDHAFIDTWVSVGWLKSRNPKFWKNLDDIIKKASEGGGSTSSEQDSQKRSLIERTKYPHIQGGKGDSALVKLTTRYKHDQWVTAAPDYDFKIVRDIENPQKNNRIPIVLKHCFPLLESIIGLGEFERGKTLQFAINSLINLYMDGVKMSIFPPIMIDPTGVVPSTIKFNPAQKWLVTKPGSISPFTVNPKGIETFQSTYQFLNAALLNMAGTTDTTVSKDADNTQGKTPEALRLLSARESSRDNWDRYMMEKAIEETYDIMVDMIATKQEKPIEFDLFEEEIKQIQKNSPDLKDMLTVSESGAYAKVKLTKDKMTGCKYRFFIDSGTSMKQDDSEVNKVAMQLLLLLIKNPQIVQALAQSPQPKNVDFGELIQVIINTSGLPNANKIVFDAPAPVAPAVDPNNPEATPPVLGPDGQPVVTQAPPPVDGAAPAGAPQMMNSNFKFKNPEIAEIANQIMGGGMPSGGAQQ